MARLQDTSPNPLPPEATGAPPSGKSILYKTLSAAFSGGLIVLIVFWFRKQLDEYGTDLATTIKGLSFWAVVLLITAAFAIMLLNSLAMRTPLPPLSVGRAFVAQQSCTAISNVIPGPSGTAARFAILYQWKVGVEDFTRATVAVSIWSNVTMISMPGIAFLILAFTGVNDFSSTQLLLFAGIAVAVSVISLALVIGGLRSDRFARWLGRLTARTVNPVRRLFRKAPIEDFEGLAAQLRERTMSVVKSKGSLLTSITVGNYWLNGALLVWCIYITGVPHSEMAFIEGLALYSVGRLSTIIQVTPGGVGVVEVAYAAVFNSVLPEQYSGAVVAGVLLYRVLTYVAPILVGGICYLIWRRIRAKEKKNETSAGAPTPTPA
jgi:putative heme transporter